MKKQRIKAMIDSFQSCKFLLGLLFIVFIGIFGIAVPVFAIDVAGFIADGIASFAMVIIELVGKLLIVLIEILIAVVQYNDFINAPAVVKGWILVRDVSNMAFLIIFIAIAFATILGVEKYEYKRLLPKLLIMAVAINFSKTICGIVIDAAQVIMITFVNGFKDVAAGNLIRGFGLADMMTFKEFGEGEAPSITATAAAAILAIVLLTIALVTMGIIVLMFLARIIYLWLLIILAPLAFMLSAVPGADGQFQKWFQKFIRYAFVGPILAFFLWLSFSIMANVSPGSSLAEDSGLDTGFGDVAENTFATITTIGSSDQLLSYAIAISLLLLALSTANGMGVAFGGMAGDALSKIKSGGMKLGKIAGVGVLTGGLGGSLAAAGKKQIWGVTKYANRKLYAGTGINLDMKDNWAGIKRSFDRGKENDLSKGRTAAGERLKSGATLTGFLGASEDASDAYLKGPLALKGLWRMAKVKVGGPKEAQRIQEEVKKEKLEAAGLAEEASTIDEALAKDDYLEEGRQAREDDEAKKGVKEGEEGRVDDAAVEKYILDDQNIIVQVTERLDKESGKMIREEKEVSIMDYLEQNSLSSDMTADNYAKLDDEEKEKYEEVMRDFDDQKARQRYNSKGEGKDIDEAIRAGDSADGDQKDLLIEINNAGKEQYAKQAEDLNREADDLGEGLLSKEEREVNDEQLAVLQKEQNELLRQIQIQANAKEGPTLSQKDRRDEIKKEMEEIGIEKNGKWEARDNVKRADFINLSAEQQAEKEAKEMKERGASDKDIGKNKERIMQAAVDEIKQDEIDRGKMADKTRLNANRATSLSNATSWSDEDREKKRLEAVAKREKAKEINQEIEKKETKAQSYIPPQAFYADRDRRLMENEEMGKITTDLDSELIAALRDAISEKNSIKAIALMKKMSKDGNDNEFLNSYGFASNSQGMHDFFNAVVVGDGETKKADGTTYTGPKLNMNKQSAYAAENDLSYINEGVNHWETARLMEVKNGQYEQMSQKDHTQGALAEIMKMNTREIGRSFNRLAYGGEIPKPDGSGRDFKLAPLGMSILKAMGPEIANHIGRGEYNKNAVMNMGPHYDEWRDHGIDEEYLNRSQTIFNQLENEAGADISTIVEKVFMTMQKQGKLK